MLFSRFSLVGTLNDFCTRDRFAWLVYRVRKSSGKTVVSNLKLTGVGLQIQLMTQDR